MQVNNVSVPLVSIIIVNYKGYEDMDRCLISLNEATYPNIEIIVVDNESDPVALNKLKYKFKNVQFFPLKENLNYAEGNNYGISRSSGNFIVLLNNDTMVEDTWLEPLVREALINPRAFYQPKIHLLREQDVIFSLGCTIHLFGIAFPIGIGKHVSEISLPKEKLEVFYCVGACIFTSREILNELGGLDSNFWTFYEDVNLGWKGKMRGFPSYLVPDSTIYHKWGGTYGQELSSMKLHLLERGRISSILRNYSIRSILILSLPLLIFDFLIMIYLIPKHMLKTKVHASIDVLLNLKIIIYERKKIQSSRIKTDKDISLYMSSTIEHPYIGKLPGKAEHLLARLSKVLLKIL
jgi:GT2 family glycosyltransferase